MSELTEAYFVIEYDNGDYELRWPCVVDLEERRIVEFADQDYGTPFNDVPEYAEETAVYVDFGGYTSDAIKDAEYNDDLDRIENEYGDEAFYLFDDEEVPTE